MKNSFRKIGFLLLGGSLLTACDDTFLEKVPQQEIAAGNFWTTESDVEMALAGCYARLKGSFLTWSRSYFDAAVDNGWAQHQTPIRLMQSGTLDPVNSGSANSLYTACYQGIATANVFLANFKKAPMADAAAKRYEAEARFLRAFFYFELAQRWGGVVIYKQVPVNIDDLKIARSSAEEVYQFIQEDLAFATENLPDIAYQSGHAVKTSALALQARIALFKGEWDKVITNTEAIIKSSHYALSADLKSPFVKGAGQLTSPEIIFSVKYLETRDGRQSNDGGQEVEFFRWGGLTPTRDLIDEYDPADLRLSEWYYYAPDKTTFTRKDGFKFQTEFTATNYGLIKFLDANDPSRFIPSERDIITGHDVVLFRLADVYLMYAEAQVEKGGGTTADANAISYVNAIRKRAGLTPITSLTRTAIRKERRKELAFEGLRYFDVVRWKIGKEINGKLIHSNINLKWDDKFYVWPFSQSEMDINRALVQNSGY
ncbi:putative outer membrane starch-binding protein [Larkinella arboricola]|uniref:Putative outer membrane starch-binding protein n=1 Tax=Larkinella arboricola TaxID=643671 RepID=A0A327WJH0_LARAB|nr:RagB/SusD family nutrient uptake outer membrane protein [Larkinella arboricola]RAJ90863.1 putative outer membrane starch-binding protein [Larkinella arboricola]